MLRGGARLLPSRQPNPHSTSILRILVVVLGIGVVVLGSALTYVLLIGNVSPAAPCTTAALTPSASIPLVSFSSVAMNNGNATFTIAAAMVCPPPTAYLFNLGYAGKGSPADAFPSSGQYTSTSVSNTTFRFYWTDSDGQGLVNVGDAFTITGDERPLPAGRDFTFYLYWLDTRLIAAENWRS